MSSINSGDSGERRSGGGEEEADLAPAASARRNLRREQIRAAALELEHEHGGGECDSPGNVDGTIAAGSSGSRKRVLLSGSLPVAMPSSSTSNSSSGAAPSRKRNTPPGDVPLSPMVTPPTASQAAPLPQYSSSTPTKPSPLPGKKGGPASPGGGGGGGGGGGVPHVYHDYGHVPDEPGYARKKTGGVTQPFPEKLYEMLESEGRLRGDVVEWLPHGRAFIVRRPKDFTDRIMPKYFRQSKLTSFQRQLNLYGFRRLTQGPDGGAYYHEMFLRGRPSLCCRMKRQKVKGTGHKQPADANTEPNFYSFPLVSSTADSDVPVQQIFALPPPGEAMRVEGLAVTSSEEVARTAATLTAPVVATLPVTAVGMSPGIASIHGAAHLLRRIASDERTTPPFAGLPPSATAGAAASTQQGTETSAALWGSGQGSFGASSPRGAYFLRQGAGPNNNDLSQGQSVPYTGPRSSTDHGFRC